MPTYVIHGDNNKTLIIKSKTDSDTVHISIQWGSQVEASMTTPKNKLGGLFL